MARTRINFATDVETLARLDALAQRLSTPGMQATRSDAARRAMLRGLDAFDADTVVVAQHSDGSPLSDRPKARKSTKKR